MKVRRVWVHSVGKGSYPFRPWWETVQEGRSLPGFAGRLAKATGNALWGQFCIMHDAARTVDSWGAGATRLARPAPFHGGNPWSAPDIAETLTGRVRAALYRGMMMASENLLVAHTDGIWTEGPVAAVPDGWRSKERVARLDVLGPQLMRYWRRLHGHPVYVVAGVPGVLAETIFERAWEGRVPQ